MLMLMSMLLSGDGQDVIWTAHLFVLHYIYQHSAGRGRAQAFRRVGYEMTPRLMTPRFDFGSGSFWASMGLLAGLCFVPGHFDLAQRWLGADSCGAIRRTALACYGGHFSFVFTKRSDHQSMTNALFPLPDNRGRLGFVSILNKLALLLHTTCISLSVLWLMDLS